MRGRVRRGLVKVVLALASAYVGLVLADAFLRLTPFNVHTGRYERNRAAAALAGVPFDERSGWEVIRELRDRGRSAFPFVTPAHFQRGDLAPIVLGGERVLPLGGISNVTTVACNETGEWMVYDADEHGFNNPSGLYAARPEVVVVGDSFAHGTCLPRGQEFVSHLREALGPTIGVATHGSGPLGMLAQVREYAARLEPRRVLWFYYEGNDVTSDIRREASDPTLRRYLEPGYRQGLLDRQAAVDRAIREQLVPPEDGGTAVAASWGEALAAVVTLREVRVVGAKALARLVRVGPIRARWFDDKYAEPLRGFEAAVTRARDDVRAWGGELVFVYLPSYDAFRAPWMDGVVLKPDVLAIVERLDVRVIDVEPAFRALDPPANAFVFGLANHYSVDGNRAVAEAVLADLVER